MIDHWLNFFMIKNLPAFRPSVEAALGVKFSSARFSKIVITQYEERGLEGRGGFFDGVGQVRDMIQSHLLQTLALLLITPADATVESISTAKSHVVDGLMDGGMTCSFGQYDGFLLEEYLTYHAEFADSTLVSCNLTAKSNNMNGVEIVIRTGKMLGEFLYSIDMYQKGGPGVLTYDIGKESLNLGDVKVREDRPPLPHHCVCVETFTLPYLRFTTGTSLTAISSRSQLQASRGVKSLR